MRQFVAPQEPDINGRIPVYGRDYAYLRQVLRLSDGECVDVRLPGGRLAPMFLRVSGLSAALETALESSCQAKTGSGVGAGAVETGFYRGTAFYLFQFLPKARKFDIILCQAVEAGVAAVVPVQGEYSPPQGDFMGRIGRFERIVREARQQSGSPVSVEIVEPVTAGQAAAWWKARRSEPSFAALLSEYPEDAGAGLHGYLKSAPAVPASAALAVGSEGGISPAERGCLMEAGFLPVHFPVNVLRSETAALYGMAALQSVIMEYKTWHVNE
jgi:16S rRNA (uracil1498-N3)-methyltransferase